MSAKALVPNNFVKCRSAKIQASLRWGRNAATNPFGLIRRYIEHANDKKIFGMSHAPLQ
jgi:hypothetical protein